MSVNTLEAAATVLGRPELVKAGSADYTFLTKEATFASFVTAVVKQASAETRAQCAEYAKFWGILDACKTAEAKLAAYVPAEIPDSAYALNETFGTEKIQKYACVSADTTVAAATSFVENRAAYPLSWRKTAAVKLLTKAARYEANLPEYVDTYLHKAAGYACPTEQSVEDAVIARMNLLIKVAETDLTLALTEMVGAFHDETVQYDDSIVKTAVDLLDRVDSHYGLSVAYGAGLALPEEMCVRTLPALAKTAAELTNDVVHMTNGQDLRVSTLSKTALAAVEAKLAGMDAAELADVLPTLPRGDADLLCRLAG